jgi:hypothetical protein
VATTKSTKTFAPKIDSIQKWKLETMHQAWEGGREYDSSSVGRRIIPNIG